MIIEGGVFEKIELNDKTQIYNPLFDEVRKNNSVYYDMEQYLSIKHALKPKIFPLTILNSIQVSNLPALSMSLSTPFQLYRYKLNELQSAIVKKQMTNSQKNIHFKIQSKPMHQMNQREITAFQIKQFKKRLIGSYSSHYYNKFELDKINDFNNKNKKKFMNDKMNMTQKKAIYIKALKVPGKTSNLLNLSINQRKPFNSTIFNYNVRIYKNS